MERINSSGSSIRGRSLNISSNISNNSDSDESVSETGDIGDRLLPSKRFSESSSSFRLYFDNRSGNGALVSIPRENKLLPNSSLIRPFPPLSSDAIVGSEDSNSKHVSSLQYLPCDMRFMVSLSIN